MFWIFVIGAYASFWIGAWILDSIARLRQQKAAELARRETELNTGVANLKRERETWLVKRTNIEEALEAMRKEKSLGFPWLAKAYSDYFQLLEMETADELETKKHPAKRSAEKIRAIAAEKAPLRREKQNFASVTPIL